MRFPWAKPARPPVRPIRREVVLELIRLGMAETDAADRDIDSREFDRAHAAADRASRRATPGELLAAHAALRRHGY